MKIDAALTSFSPCADRFVTAGYKKKMDFENQLQKLSQVKGIDAVALDFPTQFNNPSRIKNILGKFGLKLGMVEIDMYSKPEWKFGSLSSNDDKLRKRAVKLIKEGMDVAYESGASDVQLWLGQDGYDYPFQSDYLDAWDRLIDGIREIAEHRDEMKIVIEYKLKEPRNRCYINTIGKALYICEKIGKPYVGITLDVGHSLMALENPAESAVMAMREKRLFHLHLNDNYRDWDHDMIPGTVNLWETIELFYWLNKMDFDGWYGIDIYPYREDGFEALNQTVKNIYKFDEIAKYLLKSKISKLQKENDIPAIVELLRREVLRNIK